MLIHMVYPFSLQALHKKLLMDETCWSGKNVEDLVANRYWHGDREIVSAVWTLVRMCGSDDANSFRALVSDFISRVSLLDFFHFIFRFHIIGPATFSLLILTAGWYWGPTLCCFPFAWRLWSHSCLPTY